MSGGSYEYLCYKDSQDLLGGQFNLANLEEMRDRLSGMGYMDAAGQTDAVIATINEANRLVQLRATALTDVWKAVEWMDSNDWGPEQVEEAVEAYRKAKP